MMKNASLAIHCDVFEHCFRTESGESQTLFIALIKFQGNCVELQKNESSRNYGSLLYYNVVCPIDQSASRLQNTHFVFADNFQSLTIFLHSFARRQG